MKKKIFLVLAAVLVSIPSLAMTVLQLNLEQLTTLSERVFAGRCVSVRPKKDEKGRPIQEVTFEVEEMIKGEPSDTITFRQLASSALIASALPQYKVGEEAVIFLSGDGPWGLTAPVGLYQGKFDVTISDKGEKKLVNGMHNRGLFIGSKKSPRIKAMTLDPQEKQLLLKVQTGALPYDPFVSLVKKLATTD